MRQICKQYIFLFQDGATQCKADLMVCGTEVMTVLAIKRLYILSILPVYAGPENTALIIQSNPKMDTK